jgi:hypothetical protein
MAKLLYLHIHNAHSEKDLLLNACTADDFAFAQKSTAFIMLAVPLSHRG